MGWGGGDVQTTGIYSLTVGEAGSLKPRGLQVWYLLEAEGESVHDSLLASGDCWKLLVFPGL